jgi:N-methylhydantoinase B
MPMSVRAAIDSLSLEPGDIAVLNEFYAGGTHLPDISMVLPIFPKGATTPLLYVAARAHHADIGGYYPGPMGLCREIYQEGLRIPPIKIVRAGKIELDVRKILLLNLRTPIEGEGDLTSQIGACRVGRNAVARNNREVRPGVNSRLKRRTSGLL